VDELPKLKYDHAEIVRAAVATLRGDYEEHVDPAGLLRTTLPGEPAGAFTIRDLRLLHEAVLGRELVPDTFRRGVLPALTSTGQWRKGARGKPAELYARIR